MCAEHRKIVYNEIEESSKEKRKKKKKKERRRRRRNEKKQFYTCNYVHENSNCDGEAAEKYYKIINECARKRQRDRERKVSFCYVLNASALPAEGEK